MSGWHPPDFARPGDVMEHYRAYIMGWDGHILRPVELFCKDDEDAKEQARQLVDGHDVELWQLDRKITVFLSEPK
jgi:hypothetical protein